MYIEGQRNSSSSSNSRIESSREENQILPPHTHTPTPPRASVPPALFAVAKGRQRPRKKKKKAALLGSDRRRSGRTTAAACAVGCSFFGGKIRSLFFASVCDGRTSNDLRRSETSKGTAAAAAIAIFAETGFRETAIVLQAKKKAYVYLPLIPSSDTFFRCFAFQQFFFLCKKKKKNRRVEVEKNRPLIFSLFLFPFSSPPHLLFFPSLKKKNSFFAPDVRRWTPDHFCRH